MNPAQVHLMVVHVPVVGLLGVAILLAAGNLLRNGSLLHAGYVFLLLSTLCAGAAYLSGPGAWESIREGLDPLADQVETHAVLGRGLLVGLVLASLLAFNAVLQVLQGLKTPRWQHLLILASVLALSGLGAWTAHSGGSIRHPELHAPSPPSEP